MAKDPNLCRTSRRACLPLAKRANPFDFIKALTRRNTWDAGLPRLPQLYCTDSATIVTITRLTAKFAGAPGTRSVAFDASTGSMTRHAVTDSPPKAKTLFVGGLLR